MTGKELLLKAIQNETTPRPAWLPFVGSHGAKIIGKSAKEYLQSADLIIEGLKKAYELYKPDGLPIVFDLQMEAEILGCQLQWAEEGPPAVSSHPLAEGKSLDELPVFDPGNGRFPIAIEALRRTKADIGDQVALYGLICGPFTLALHLMGNDLFMQMFDHPDYVKAVVGFCASAGRKAALAYLGNGADVIAVVDPMTSQISPEHFDEFVAPHVNEIFDFVHDRGAFTSMFVCGDATRNLEKMCQTRCDNVSIDENIPLELVRDLTRSAGKSLGGNVKLTLSLLLGDEDDCRLDAIKCIEVGGNCGFILAPGCDIPFNTPEVNLQAVAEMVHDDYNRQVAKRTIAVKEAAIPTNVKLPDYENEPGVFVDVVTLDSLSCAPCQYMMDAVHRAAKATESSIVVKEHKVTTREGIAAMMQLGVSNIPTICIDGEVAFASIIPDQDTLVAQLQARVSGKVGIA